MKTLATLLATLIATVAVAASDPPGKSEAQAAGSEKAKAAAEKTHNARVHGLAKTKQTEAQAQSSEKAQAKAEAKHLKKSHGTVNDAADKRTQKDAAKL